MATGLSEKAMREIIKDGISMEYVSMFGTWHIKVRGEQVISGDLHYGNDKYIGSPGLVTVHLAVLSSRMKLRGLGNNAIPEASSSIDAVAITILPFEVASRSASVFQYLLSIF